ncbi:MAG: nucleotide sugar dehydrogenase [Phycisphaerales bacterium]|nr:nucleotide sugar dehydrogenase [Phycisphaerales bacterium]
MDVFSTLKSKLSSGNATIGIIGLGYVGLPLAHALHEGGFRILGFDIDPSKIEALAVGRNYLKHLGEEMTTTLSRSDRFRATADFSRLSEADAIIICVPTPLGKHQEPDLSYVINSGRDIGRTLRRGQLVVLESTTYPGTTREDLLPAMLEAQPKGAEKLVSGKDFFVAFSPEREDPGRKSHNTKTTPKLVGGLERESGELASLMYARAIQHVVTVSTAEVAEAAKVLENTFRAVNIALVNELKMILTPMGIDVWDVIEAAATKPFGFMPFFPGPGLGGHCIPIDPFYLTWKAREVGKPTRFIELAGEINTSMPHYVVDRLAAALNDESKSVKGSKVLIVGLAYKPNIDDTRETPAAEIIEILAGLGADVSYHDPHVPTFPRMRKHTRDLKSIDLSKDVLTAFDAVLIVTDHAAVNWRAIAQHAKLVVDTRNAMKGLGGLGARVVKA